MANAPTSTLEGDDALERVGRLYDAQHQRIYRLARRLTRDAESARDLLQETFLRAARRASSLPRGRAAAEAWLVRTAVNLCRDRGRRRAVRERDRHKLEPPAPAGSDPERSAVARASVEAALATLAPRRRAAVVLAELEELPTREVARLLGCREATVRWHLSRARRELETWRRAQFGDAEETRR